MRNFVFLVLTISFFIILGIPAAPPAYGDDLPPSEDEFFDEFEEFGYQEEDSPKKVYDPLKGYNRVMFHFNDKMYFWVMKPVAKGYNKVVPEPVQLSIKRFFHNVRFPLRFANNILQLKLRGAGREFARFVTNSTVGFAGFFDPARVWWGLEPSEEDFGQTLGHYGVGDGFPITLPILGPSNLRDTLSLAAGYYSDPVSYLEPHEKVLLSPARIAIRVVEFTNDTSLQLGFYENIKKNALDPYTFVRDAYKQNRDKKIEE